MTARRSIEQTFSEEQIIQAGLTTVERALDRIQSEVASNEYSLDEIWYPRLQKYLLMIDHDAQKEAEQFLQQTLKGIQIRGEESTLQPFVSGLAALLDMVDGTDLLKRNLGNWCSAMTIFDPGEKRIVTALVGMSNKDIYFTRYSRPDCAFVRTPSNEYSSCKIFELKMEKRNVELRDAAIAFYGQKPSKLATIMKSHPKAKQWLLDIAREMNEKKEREDCPKVRIYNLAGNPMMVNVIDGYVDAVVETSGQKCHDVVPGFLIALKAGAALKDFSNNDITEYEIASRLSDPGHKFKYVLACNEKLASDLVELFHPTVSSISG